MKPKINQQLLTYITGYKQSTVSKILAGDRIDNRGVREAKKRIESLVEELRKEWDNKTMQ